MKPKCVMPSRHFVAPRCWLAIAAASQQISTPRWPAILGVANFASANRDRLEELEVNPLGIRRRGCGAFALDALVRTREAEA